MGWGWGGEQDTKSILIYCFLYISSLIRLFPPKITPLLGTDFRFTEGVKFSLKKTRPYEMDTSVDQNCGFLFYCQYWQMLAE